MVFTLVLVRHGESTWNKENRFTGWTDVPLSEQGKIEAIEAGKMLKEKNFFFDIAYTSVLKRAVNTLWSILTEIDQHYIPVKNSWRLNERHYGALQGLNKSETAAKHGDEQVLIWRRAYDIPPPSLENNDKRCADYELNYKYCPKDCLPKTECLKDTVNRVLPYWFDYIAPDIINNKNVLLVAHGNSIRALIKHIDNISDDDILKLNIPTGIPLIYEFDEKTMKPIKHYYLIEGDELQKRLDAVANQGKAK
eukprot:GHVL01024498.1.p1 GENE.GHVL01024498.1~~GHVL01024498.1.p1  ORF type:complete len:251 (-),score=73.23 GHVL01024498.1:57-809(-)